MRRLIFLLAIAAMSSFVWCQNGPTDSQTLRALLEEVRQLRRDLQTTTVAAQRVQIALYRLQLQDAALARAMKLVEEAHAKLAALAAERKRLGSEIEQLEDKRNRTPDLQERRAIEQEILPELKRHAEQLTNEEQQWRGKANEAEGQLNVEQQKLDALHALLDQLDQALQNVGRKGENPSYR
jgi:chromosome segregation ATPase